MLEDVQKLTPRPFGRKYLSLIVQDAIFTQMNGKLTGERFLPKFIFR
jgi:hypothetical protein